MRTFKSEANKDECCGECRWHRSAGGNWVCANDCSENCGYPTEWTDKCDDFEERL